MSVASDHVAFFRTYRADRYIDTVTVRDRTDRGTYNRATMQYDSPTTATVYNGGALIRPVTAAIEDRGGEGATRFDYRVELPYTATGITVGNEVTVDASTYSTDLVGQILTVEDVTWDSYETHITLGCVVGQGGGDVG